MSKEKCLNSRPGLIIAQNTQRPSQVNETEEDQKKWPTQKCQLLDTFSTSCPKSDDWSKIKNMCRKCSRNCFSSSFTFRPKVNDCSTGQQKFRKMSTA
jgi:hypothetical protein